MLNVDQLEQTVDIEFGECFSLLSVLTVLFLLHCYWFYLFLLAWMEFFKKGEVDDFHEDGLGEQLGSCNCVECTGGSKIIGKGEYQFTKAKCKKRIHTSNILGKKPKSFTAEHPTAK